MEDKGIMEVKEKKEIDPPSLSPGSRLQYYYSIGRFVLIILLVVCLGLFAINQAINFRYKAVFLASPCQLCKDVNLNQSKCIDGCFTYRIETGIKNTTKINMTDLDKYFNP